MFGKSFLIGEKKVGFFVWLVEFHPSQMKNDRFKKIKKKLKVMK